MSWAGSGAAAGSAGPPHRCPICDHITRTMTRTIPKITHPTTFHAIADEWQLSHRSSYAPPWPCWTNMDWRCAAQLESAATLAPRRRCRRAGVTLRPCRGLTRTVRMTALRACLGLTGDLTTARGAVDQRHRTPPHLQSPAWLVKAPSRLRFRGRTSGAQRFGRLWFPHRRPRRNGRARSAAVGRIRCSDWFGNRARAATPPPRRRPRAAATRPGPHQAPANEGAPPSPRRQPRRRVMATLVL